MTEHAPDTTLIRRGAPARESGLGVVGLFHSIRRHWGLVVEMARREIVDMHAGQTAGIVWLIVHPILFFAVYAFLFGSVFNVRIRNGAPSDYLIYLFSGLVPWLITQDVMSRSATVMIANTSIVKKVMFPVEVLVAKTVLASASVQFVLFFVVVAYIVIAKAALPAVFLLFPVVLLLHLLLLCGLALLLSSITPYFRDVPEFVRLFCSVNVYLMPVVYLPEMVPDVLKVVLAANPFSYLIWCYQDILYFGEIRHPGAWAALAVFASGVLAVGSFVFVRLRSHFGSVL